ncbi:MAG: MFS transporter [Burkholderiales bacterium]
MTRAHVFLVVAAASAVMALTFGVRMSLGLFISPINTQTGLGLVAISFAYAVSQLMWGVSQPIAGAIADRHGAGKVIAGGLALLALGTALTPLAGSAALLVLVVGIVIAAGAGAGGLSIALAAVARLLPVEKRAMASGIVSAGGSVGQFTLVPLAQGLIGWVGWMAALWWLAAFAVASIPLAWVLRGKAGPTPGAAREERLGEAVRRAFGDRNYVLLNLGFFTCGFHVAFIMTHLPGVVAYCALPPTVAAWSLGVIGLFNIAGSLAVGWAMGRWRSKSLLALLYATRAVAVAVFLASPKTELTFFLFAAVLGFTWLSTVPPTGGLVAKFYGPRFMATLFGVVLLSHQVGAFFGAYLGGIAFAATGSYDWMWWADIALALFAAAVHLPIREQLVRVVPVPT